MENKNENMTNKLDVQRLEDQQLEDVAGGSKQDYVTTPHITNRSKYTSGDTPKYAVGQRLKIAAGDSYVKIPCEVLSVSESATGGFWYKEFVYSIVILPFKHPFRPKFEELIGEEYNGVYESCLYE